LFTTIDLLIVLFLAASAAFGAKPKSKTASAGQQNQDYHGHTNRPFATTTAVLLANGDAVDVLEAHLETQLGLGGSGLQHPLRRSCNNRNHGDPRLVAVLMGGHKGFDVVVGEKTADQSTQTLLI
jgi:hypothetical protein